MAKEQHPDPDDDRLLAAEIALGLADLHSYERQLQDDPALGVEVERWREKLAPLIDDISPVLPPPETWTLLKARLRTNVAPSLPRVKQAAQGVWTGRFAGWRWLAGAGLAACAAFAILVGARLSDPDQPRPGAEAPRGILFVSSLLPKDGPPLFIASIDLATAVVVAVPAASDTLTGGVPTLWLVPKDDGDPISIGKLATTRPTKFVLNSDVLVRTERGASLVITMEPDDATERASRGPVVAHGVFVEP